MKQRLLKQASREYSPTQRLAFLVLLVPIFIGLLPLALIWLSGWLDGMLSLPRGATGWLQLLIGGVAVQAGWLFAIWSIYVQFTRGRGTPVPLMATQRLVITPPFTYCRNPMAGGTIVATMGIAVFIGSWSAAALVALGAAALLTYIHKVEEAEMVARFGVDYEAYRRSTPFIIPRFTRRS